MAKRRHLLLTKKLCLATALCALGSAGYVSKGNAFSSPSGVKKHPEMPAENSAKSQKKGASQHNDQAPVLINAETLTYDQENEVVMAAGKVEIYQDQRILMADKVTYSRKNDTVLATGNVSLLESTGDVFFAEQMELASGMKDGIARQFRARFSDNSLLAAKSAKRSDGNLTILEKAVYSPCPLCVRKDGTSLPPQWQIKANKVTVNQREQNVTYKHAWFELYGVPALYTPYFSHATPNADAKSGFLVPGYGNIGTLGTIVKVPYYIAIAPNKDLTLTPIFTSKEGAVMSGEWRHLTTHGQYDLKGSITNPNDYRTDSTTGEQLPGRRLRWHIDGHGRFVLREDWAAGMDIKRASDDTYLRRYKFGDEDYLTSRAYAERIKNRDYAIVQSISFQELNTADDANGTPFILPNVITHFERPLDNHGQRILLDTNAFALSRSEGTDTRRFSATAAWKKPYVTRLGHVFQLNASLRGDAYNMNGVTPETTESQGLENGYASRVIPEVELDWRYPLVQQRGKYNLFLEPTANLILSPYQKKTHKIPNEDSQALELEDDNLFNSSHYSGLDRVESGPRANYGIRTALHGPRGGSAHALFGQSYHVKPDANLNPGSGLSDTFSDYVGRISLKPNEKFDVSYRFRLDKERFTMQHNEVNSALAIYPFTFNVSYLAVNEGDVEDDLNDRKEVYASASVALSKQWTLSADGRKNLAYQGGVISAGSSLAYHGDCTDITTSVVREFVRDRDITPSTSFLVQVSLKNLQ